MSCYIFYTIISYSLLEFIFWNMWIFNDVIYYTLPYFTKNILYLFCYSMLRHMLSLIKGSGKRKRRYGWRSGRLSVWVFNWSNHMQQFKCLGAQKRLKQLWRKIKYCRNEDKFWRRKSLILHRKIVLLGRRRFHPAASVGSVLLLQDAGIIYWPAHPDNPRGLEWPL